MVVLYHILNTIRAAYEDGLDQVLIVEDDINFGLMPYWGKTLEEIIEEFPKDWMCVSLFNLACYIIDDADDYIHIKDKICNGSVAYIINKKGMEDVLNTMSTNLLVLDHNNPQNHNTKSKYTCLADVFIFNRIKYCYERKIPLFIPYNEVEHQDSTIHPHHTAKHNKFATEIIKIYNPDLNLIDLK